MNTCKQIQVIETTLERRGAGTIEDPVRIITQYWSLDGKLLAEVDPLKTGYLSEICEEGNLEQRNLSHLRDLNIQKSVHRSMSRSVMAEFVIGTAVQNINPADCSWSTGVIVEPDSPLFGLVTVRKTNDGQEIRRPWYEMKMIGAESRSGVSQKSSPVQSDTLKCDPQVYSNPSDFFVGAFVKNVCTDNPCRPFTGVVICVDELTESGIVKVSRNSNGGNIDCHYSELKVLTPEPANDHPDSK